MTMTERSSATAWMEDAACQGVDPSVFFAERGDMTASREAKRICNTCDVRYVCLETNLHELDGVWGGMTAAERQKIRVKRAKLKRSLR